MINKLENNRLHIAGHALSSRLLLGTGKFASYALMQEAIEASGSALVTVALRRVDMQKQNEGDILDYIPKEGVQLLPNTSGARDAKEAVFAAELGREALNTDWVKLEIHPNPRHLLPDPIETLKAAEILANKGFIVLPYINADPMLCKRLEDVGCAAVMPLASPIGSNEGIGNRRMLEIIIAESNVPVIIDAGLGLPSHACDAMELGADAVLVNTAIASCADPRAMAEAFKWAVMAGRQSYFAGAAGQQPLGMASSPLTQFLD